MRSYEDKKIPSFLIQIKEMKLFSHHIEAHTGCKKLYLALDDCKYVYELAGL